jgi:hypothetical protein
MQQDHIVDVPGIMPGPDPVLYMLVKRVQVDVSEKLATQITNGQAEVGRLVEQTLVRWDHG